MRRYIVRLNGEFKKMEHFTDKEKAEATAKKWRACYDGRVTVYDNMTGLTKVY